MPRAKKVIRREVRKNLIQESSSSRCLICWGRLPKQKPEGSSSANGKRNQDVFTKICSILRVDLSSSKWDFRKETFPFCGGCTKGIHQLIRLHKKLESIQKEIETGIQGIRNQLNDSDPKFISTDLRIINFRSMALGQSTEIQNNHSSGNYYSTGQQYRPSHGTNILIDGLSAFSSNSNTAVVPSNKHHENENIHARPEFGQIGLVEVQVDYNESNRSTDSDSENDNDPLEMFDDPYDEDYDPPSSPVHNYDKYLGLDTSKKRKGRTQKNTSPSAKRQKLKGVQESTSTKHKNSQKGIRTRVNQNSTRSKESEYFSPLRTTKDGKTFYDDIEIAENDVGYVCGMCGYDKVKGLTSIALRKMKIHIKGVHFDAYKCKICNRNFSSNDILNQHIKRVHEAGLSPCIICQKPIRGRESSMQAHLWTHRNAEEKAEARAQGLEPKDVYHKVEEEDKQHQCPTCGKKFQKPFKLRKHLQTHLSSDSRTYVKCTQCDKQFTTKASLNLHIKTSHELDKLVRWFSCAFCEKKFYLKVYHDEHVARKHKSIDEQHLSCSICNKKFVLKKDLKTHENNHRPVEYYTRQCDVCGLRTKNDYTLSLHRRKRHPKPKRVRISLDVDEIQKQQLAQEKINILKPFETTANDDKLYFEGFEVSKLGAGGFSCLTCETGVKTTDENRRTKKFTEEGVKIHIIVDHLGGHPCNMCDIKFKEFKELTNHKKSVHYLLTQKCNVCGMDVDRNRFRNHLWSHKSQEEMATAINSGEPIPAHFKSRKDTSVHMVEQSIIFKCSNCPKAFSSIIALNDHRMEVHPKLTTMMYRKNSARKLGHVESKASTKKAKSLTKLPLRTKRRRRESSSSFESEGSISMSDTSDTESSSDDDEDNSSQSPNRRLIVSKTKISNPSKNSSNFKVVANAKTSASSKLGSRVDDDIDDSDGDVEFEITPIHVEMSPTRRMSTRIAVRADPLIAAPTLCLVRDDSV